MLPLIRKARPPTMRCAATPASVATSSRIRLARSSSYAIDAAGTRSARAGVVVVDRPALDLGRRALGERLLADQLDKRRLDVFGEEAIERRARVPHVDDPPAAVRRGSGAVEDQPRRGVAGRVDPGVDLVVERLVHTALELEPHC